MRNVKLQPKDLIPMKNSSIDKLNSLMEKQKNQEGYKNVSDAELRDPYFYNDKPLKGTYSISKEFDGNEVEGTLKIKKTLGGKYKGVEKFNFPNGGTRLEKTVYNNEGRPIRRTTKDKKIN